TSIEALSQLRDVATPHTTGDSGPVPIPWRNIDNIAPAGSINSSALDMARWLKFLLAGGRHDGRPLLSDSSMRMITSPHTMMPHSRDTLRPSIHFLAYGLGVMTYDYRGVKVLSHGGGIDGMLSDVTWIPERDFGVVVLANTDGNNLAQVALTRWIVDRMLGAPEVDWSSVLLNDIRRYQRDMTLLRVRLDSLRPRNTSPGVDLERYTGRFEHPLYGAIEIADADALTLRLVGGPGGTLSHWAHDTFLLQWESAGPALRPAHVTFDIDPTGRVEALTIRDDLLAPPGERVWERDRFTREKGSP
ncbi:MAG TPA: DUF3471 domain-containing protein, partial [Gemmatimonadaceae bacterium]|nr:DUF3471 domain-containing protein [Gemmatimonadaceae bacterium]